MTNPTRHDHRADDVTVVTRQQRRTPSRRPSPAVLATSVIAAGSVALAGVVGAHSAVVAQDPAPRLASITGTAPAVAVQAMDSTRDALSTQQQQRAQARQAQAQADEKALATGQRTGDAVVAAAGKASQDIEAERQAAEKAAAEKAAAEKAAAEKAAAEKAAAEKAAAAQDRAQQQAASRQQERAAVQQAPAKTAAAPAAPAPAKAAPVKAQAAPAPKKAAPAAPAPTKAAPAKSAPQPAPASRPSGSPRSIARSMLGDFGWGSSQFGCLDSLWAKESGWNPSAQNASSGAYGIPQSLPGSKMASAGADWRTNPATQIRWGLGYINGRYGSPCAAWAHSQANNWY